MDSSARFRDCLIAEFLGFGVVSVDAVSSDDNESDSESDEDSLDSVSDLRLSSESLS